MSTSESGDGRPIHILFVGAGAVGCFYASRLHHPTKNIHVSLVCRSNYPTIAASGVTLETRAFGTYTFTPSAVFPSISAAAAAAAAPSPWDYVIVTTKALPDVTDDSADIAPLVDAASGKTCVVLIQNGVGIEAAHRARFPRNPIVSAVTVISAEQLRHGYVRQNRWTRISMGAYTDGLAAASSSAAAASSPSTTTTTSPSSSSSSAPAEELSDLATRGDACVRELVRLFNDLGGLRDAEHHTELELQQIRWHKLTINAAMNPSAILSGGRGNADMVVDPDLREHLRGVMQEIWDAAPRVLGAPFPTSLASPEQVLRSTERNKGGKPSMLLDWERGAPLETEVILGLPIRIARSRGVELPRLQTVYALLRSQAAMRGVREREGREKREGGGGGGGAAKGETKL